MLYPAAYLALTSAVTIILIVLGLAGRAVFAAELAIVQGALLATFYAFSANTRSLILQRHGELTAQRLLAKRVLSLPVLCAASYLLCAQAAGISPALSLLLILRRSCEWLAEVRVCEMEVESDRRSTVRVLVVQASATLAAVLVLVALPRFELPALALFAITPLIGARPRLRLASLGLGELRITLRGVSPHIGSTVVTGVSIYVSRLIVFLVASAELAGFLFTAFALGSFIATLFANVLGPTLALQRERKSHHGLLRLLRWAIAGMALGGTALAGTAAASGLSAWLGKPGYFWFALGLSFAGGAVMIVAQVVRLRIFAAQVGDVLFGPDVLRSLALILAIPALYHLVHPAALGAVYFVDALLTLFFYFAAREQALRADGSQPDSARLTGGIALAIVFPLFFLLSGRIFHTPFADPLLDSGGSVMNVPLPISLVACFAGLLVVARYRSAVVSMGVIFFLFVGMVFTTLIATAGSIGYESRKLLLLFQFLVPVFALVLGEMIGDDRNALRVSAWVFLLTLAVVVPLQLVRSIGYGYNELRHDLWLFSIYQHRQFVPVVLVAAYVVAMFALWESTRARPLCVIMAPVMGFYAAASYSTLALGLEAAALIALLAMKHRDRAAYVLVGLAVCVNAGYMYWNRDAPPLREKYSIVGATTAPRPEGATSTRVELTNPLPRNVARRMQDWTLYGGGIVESSGTVLFGHREALDRSVSTSAHNYYLDFLYNFGVVALLPLLWLVGYTVALLWRARRRLAFELPLLGLAIAVLFAILLDNNFKVSFRQPYPGIFFFFLWGLLLARLAPGKEGPRRGRAA